MIVTGAWLTLFTGHSTQRLLLRPRLSEVSDSGQNSHGAMQVS